MTREGSCHINPYAKPVLVTQVVQFTSMFLLLMFV